MNVSQSQATQRWNSLPERLREALFSEFVAESVLDVCKNHHLIEEKAAIVKTYAAYVLMGFLHPEEFSREVQSALSLPVEIAKPLGEEMYKKVFSEYANEIQGVYAPASLEKETESGTRGVEEIISETSDEKTITFAGLGKETSEPEETLPINVPEKTAAESPKTEESPFVLQEEKPVAEAVKPSLKKLSFSLGGFFGPKKKEEKTTKEPIRAKIELFAGGKEDKEKRVVHYSELRTPLGESVFRPAEEIKTTEPVPVSTPIVPEIKETQTPAKKAPWSFKWFGAQSPARDEQKSVPSHEAVGASFEEKKEEPAGMPQKEESGTPRIEGNTVDLRK